ncbi:MAG: hypothetical protein PHW82_17115 [Bacteroidales bacterium]|nr:hypothetical protein [Bacteroidales bacterium]
MNKKKQLKQLNLIVSVEFHDLLKEIAAYDDKSVSQLVRDLFETLEPGLRQARDLMAKAHSMNAKARKVMMPEIVRHGEQLQSNVKYGLENIEKALKDSDQ